MTSSPWCTSWLLLPNAWQTFLWNNINRRKEGIPKERKLQWIQSKKRNTSIRVLCQGLPPVFKRILRYAREELGYVHKPDYEWIRQRFEDAFTARRYSNDHMYDWDFLRRDEKRRYENNENFRVDLRTVELMELIEYEESRTGTPRAVVPEQEVQLPEKPMIPISPSTPAAPSLIPATTARTHVVRMAERLRDWCAHQWWLSYHDLSSCHQNGMKSWREKQLLTKSQKG